MLIALQSRYRCVVLTMDFFPPRHKMVPIHFIKLYSETVASGSLFGESVASIINTYMASQYVCSRFVHQGGQSDTEIQEEAEAKRLRQKSFSGKDPQNSTVLLIHFT